MTRQLPPVTLDHVELVRVHLPLVRPFRTSFGVQHVRDALLVHVRDADGVDGWGEVATTAAPVYDAEHTDGAAQVLAAHLVPTVRADGPVHGAEVPARLTALHGHHAARAALETAVWDLQLRTAGVALADHLDVVRDRVPAGVSVGIPDGDDATAVADALVTQVAAHRDEGYRRIKIKVTPGADVALVTALRDAFGDALPLQVDANAAYDPDDADHVAALDALDELGLLQLEQPFAPQRLLDHVRHAARWRTPVCLDESATDRWTTRDALELHAGRVVNLKVGRVGGLTEALAVHDLCRARDVPLWIGGMLETGVGRTLNVTLAALPGVTDPGDTSASDRYWHDDLTAPFELRDGHLVVDRSPGAGRAPDPDRLATCTTAVEVLRG